MALALLKNVGGVTSFVRFVGTDTLKIDSGADFPLVQRFRLYSALATMRLATCPRQTPINALSTFLQGRILLFLAGFANAPSSLTGFSENGLFLDDVSDVECVPTQLALPVCDTTGGTTPTACPIAERSRYTLGVVWGDEERPFTVESGINVFLTPFASTTNPTFAGLSTFISQVTDPVSSTSLRTGLPLNAQVQVVRTLFPECQTTKVVAAGTCGTAATSERGTGRAPKSSGFCFVPPLGFRNTCAQTIPSDFGCFCDECCYVFSDCCPDIEFCGQSGGLGNECHDPTTDAIDPTLIACKELCGV